MPTIEEQIAQVEWDFTNHPPKDPRIGEVLDDLATDWITLTTNTLCTVPPGREMSLVKTHLELALMYARAGVARNQDAVLDALDEA